MTTALDAAAREIGNLARTYREKGKLKLFVAAAAYGTSVSNLSRLEHGERRFKSETDFIHYLVACKASLDDIRTATAEYRELVSARDLWVRPHELGLADSLKTLIFHESQAIKSVSYEPEVIPGLLQVEAYARVVAMRRQTFPDWLEESVQARLQRQQVLFRKTNAKFTFFIHERALLLMLSDPRIMMAQLVALLKAMNRPNISIRLVPEALGYGGVFGGAFRLLGFERFPRLAYLDAAMGGVFVENPSYTAEYVSLNRELVTVALDAEQSRVRIERLLAECVRLNGDWDDIQQVAEQPS